MFLKKLKDDKYFSTHYASTMTIIYIKSKLNGNKKWIMQNKKYSLTFFNKFKKYSRDIVGIKYENKIFKF